MWKDWLSKERSNSMVGANFENREDAQSAAEVVRADSELGSSRVDIIEPGDSHIERKLEPESRRILGTLVKAHVVLGACGLVVGLVVSLVLVGYGLRPFASSPATSIGLITAFATLLGLLAGGLFTLRPDHFGIINQARAFTESGHWFLVVHTRRPDQRRRAKRILHQFSGNTVQTI